MVTPITICGLTADNLREHIETDRSDTALERLLQDACDSVTARIGPEGEQEVVLKARGSDQFIFLPRPITVAGDIDSIVERLGNTELTLETTDWRWLGGRRLERVISGTIPAPTVWGWNFTSMDGDVEFQVVITYTPKPESRRVRVLIDLVRLALQYTALKSELAGDYSSSSLDYQKEREALISELVPRLRFA